MGSQYEFWLTDDRGVRLTLLKNISNVQYSRTTDGYGSLDISFPFDDYYKKMPGIFQPDWRIDVWRSPMEGMPKRREGSFFLRKFIISQRHSDNVKIMEMFGRSPLDILRRFSVTGSPSSQNYIEADNMMKNIVSSWVTPSQSYYAPQSGEWSVDTNLGLGPVLSKNYLGMTVLDALTEIKASTFLRHSNQANMQLNQWVSRASPSTIAWRAICWSPALGIFCAIASNDVIGNIVAISSDGINWTTGAQSNVSHPASDNQFFGICWSPDLAMFMAVATGTIGMYSKDGVNWTYVTLPSGGWKNICWNSIKQWFVAVGDSGTYQSMTSPDGITWTTHAVPAAYHWTAVCHSPDANLCVAVCSDAQTKEVMTSVDGSSWALKTTPVGSSGWQSVDWSPTLGLFAAVSQTNNAMYSPDGNTWTLGKISNQSSSLSPGAVCWSPQAGMFLSVGENSLFSLYSKDGITWNVIPSAGAGVFWSAICWSPSLGMFAAVANFAVGTNNYFQTYTIPAHKIFFDVVEGPGLNKGFGYIFRTFIDQRGVDRTASGIVFSTENGNLDAPTYYEDYLDEVTSVIAANTSKNLTLTQESIDNILSRWNRIQYYHSSSETSISGLAAEAQKDLADKAAAKVFNAAFLSTPGSRTQPRSLYGVDWDLGDTVNVKFAKRVFTADIMIVYVTINEVGKENITGHNLVGSGTVSA